jgi:hypothetical protein
LVNVGEGAEKPTPRFVHNYSNKLHKFIDKGLIEDYYESEFKNKGGLLWSQLF